VLRIAAPVTRQRQFSAAKNDQAFAGATLQGWFAPNITTDSHKGVGAWSKDDLVQYLKAGTNN
jgi:hypothetical protein